MAARLEMAFSSRNFDRIFHTRLKSFEISWKKIFCVKERERVFNSVLKIFMEEIMVSYILS